MKQRNADKEETTAIWDMSYDISKSLGNMNFVEMKMSSHWTNEDIEVLKLRSEVEWSEHPHTKCIKTGTNHRSKLKLK